jgi:hypothetical protein
VVRVPLPRFFRPLVVAAGVLSLAGAVAAQPGAPTVASLPATSLAKDVRLTATAYPTNAGKIFKWGNAQWNDEFVGPLKPMWSVSRQSQVRDQHGMLTLDATPTTGTVVAALTGHSRQYGRWEARVRSRQYAGTGTPYRVAWELVPNTGDHCGARSIVLSDYAIGSRVATAHLRNTPDDYSFGKSLDLGNQFHTFAVEVTPDHVSWFVDTRVVMTERRASARTGASYDVRFRLVGTPGTKMRKGRLQMDWVRYYTLARTNALPITAPQATLGTYADAC